MYDRIKTISAIVAMNRATENSKVIGSLYEALGKEYENMKDPIKGCSGITGVMYGTLKTDYVKAYVAKLTKLVLNSYDSELRGVTNESLVSCNNDMVLAIVSRLASSNIKSHKHLFDLSMCYLFGYDLDLLEIGTSTDRKLKLKHLIKFVTNKFDLAAGYPNVEDYYEDYISGIDPDWFFDNIDTITDDLLTVANKTTSNDIWYFVSQQSKCPLVMQ